MTLFSKNIKNTLLVSVTVFFCIFAHIHAANISISAQVGTGGGGGDLGGGGGGGGGGGNLTEVVFSGRAYPYSPVIILKNGIESVRTVSGGDGKFEVHVKNLSSGSYTFSILAEDDNGRRSTLYTFPLYITNGISTTISGIYIAPTIAVDKTVVQKGDVISIFGQSAPNALITISVNSSEPHFLNTYSDPDGVYLSTFNTSVLEYGAHTTKSQSTFLTESTSYSPLVEFQVGNMNVLTTCADRGDLTGDCRVNIIDFSILAYWYGRINPPISLDLSGDKKITLVDFSIMAYYWTG